MQISSTQTLVQMLPSHSAKRKLVDDSNPLLNAAKKAKTDHARAAASNKRKLDNGEELPGGMRIVRVSEPFSRPTSAQGNSVASSSRQTSQPPPERPPERPPSRTQSNPSSSHSSIPHPAKKFKADSQPPSSRPSSSRPPPSAKLVSRPHKNASTPNEDESTVIDDIRAMEDEADRLRRESRARRLDPSLLEGYPSGSLDTSSVPVMSNGKPRRSMSVTFDTTAPVPVSESPIIAKNKRLREGAMAAIREGQEEEPEDGRGRGRPRASSSGSGSSSGNGHRRRSSVSGRGKRISSSFELGLIPQPHKHVSENTFYKHIDPDLPENERLTRLLIWCSYRAAQAFDPSSPSYAPQPDLPPLTAEETETFKKAQETVIRLLAEKKIDFSSATPPRKSSRAPPPKENEQNASNRRYEAAYTEQIRKMEEENRTWSKVGEFYDSYIKKEKESMVKRKELIQRMNSFDYKFQSSKAKGKQKASEAEEDDWSWLPSESHVSESSRSLIALSKSVLGIRTDGSSEREQAEEVLQERLKDLEFNLDQLQEYVNVGRAATNVAEGLLDERYKVLSDALAARSGITPPSFLDHSGPSSSAARLLQDYMPREGGGPPRDKPSPHALLKALAKVDSERPPTKVGDAARRAAREVQRMEQEGGTAGLGERRLTGVPPLPTTPRKVPGTPRRGNTPGRERGTTPGR